MDRQTLEWDDSAYSLMIQCKRAQKQLSLRYQEAKNASSPSGAGQWLVDNFYILSREERETRTALKANPKGVARLAVLFFGELRRHPLGEQELRDLILMEDSRSRLTVEQLEQVALSLKVAYLLLAADAFGEEEREEWISRAVLGLQQLGGVDFAALEELGAVEETLWEDPAGIYPRMTVESRRQYCRTVAWIAKLQREKEETVARWAVNQARAGGVERTRHVGYPLRHQVQMEEARRRRGRLLLWGKGLLPLALSLAGGWWAKNGWIVPALYLPLWEACGPFLQRLAMAGVKTDYLPRMELTPGEAPRCAVVVTTLLPSAARMGELGEHLEQLYLSNREENLVFCVLADFPEGPALTAPEDDSQARAAREMIEELNSRWGSRFLLALRPRTYLRQEDLYRGWERKRGALVEWVRFLKGFPVTWHTFCGDAALVQDCPLVIALDSDTQLLFGSAKRMIAAAVHPLNRPEVDKALGRVTEGYGILTPRMVTRMEGKTRFSRLMEGWGGVTPYDLVSRDGYQDLFGESIFCGKGIFWVDTFFDLLSERFPQNQVLSHDVLEGEILRTGFLSDIELADAAPRTATEWLERLHRWVRGDWQNAGCLWDGQFSPLSRYKIGDNLRRSLTPAAVLLAVVLAACSTGRTAAALAVAALLALCLSPVVSALETVLAGGWFAVSRKYFTGAIPKAFELLGRAASSLILLPQRSFVALDGAVRGGIRRFFTHRKCLEWRTAAQSGGGGLALSRYLPAQMLGLLLLFSRSGEGRFFGLCFSLIIPFVWFTAQSGSRKRGKLTPAQRDALQSQAAAMWNFYEDYVNRENHFLPPDNVQFAPVLREARRTSPTNIGMYLLSALAARDLGLIDSKGLALRVGRTIASVERLEKWQGNLYNWYDTSSLTVLPPRYVSAVDSGNLACCLVALKEGLKEYRGEEPALTGLIRRVEALVDGTDLSPFYNKKRNLFSIGYDSETGELSASCYDFLMSEARMMSYFALSMGQAPRRHWGAMNRSMSRSGFYAGPLSWTGTMFEYYMPHLLLPAGEGTLLCEGLRYCLYCQKKRVRAKKLPWGISESGYYAFDGELNYQYKAHGVQLLGVKNGLDQELVLSPYSTYLVLPFSPQGAFANLKELEALGLWGKYGLYEALDLTPSRLEGNSSTVVKSYMAHHVGMSLAALDNAFFENAMQRRFLRDKRMKSAREFLEEPVSGDPAVCRGEGEEGPAPAIQPQLEEYVGKVHPQSPRCVFLCNGEVTDVLTDVGAGFFRKGEIELTRRGEDLLRHPQGVYAFFQGPQGCLAPTAAPFYQEGTEHQVKLQGGGVTYFGQKGNLAAELFCGVYPRLPVTSRTLTLHNRGGDAIQGEVLFYLEPVLSTQREYEAHPAFSKLFLEFDWERESRVVTVTRRLRHGGKGEPLTAGLLEEFPYELECKRENLTPNGKGMEALKDFAGLPFLGSNSVPDGAVALRVKVELPAGGKKKLTLLLAAGGPDTLIAARREGELTAKTAAQSPMLRDSGEGRLAMAVLGQLFYNKRDGRHNLAALRKNTLGQPSLWPMGISGDLPIAVVETGDAPDPQRLEAYLRLHAMLRLCLLRFDLALLFDSRKSPLAAGEILEMVQASGGMEVLGARGGIHLVDSQNYPPENILLLKAAARHISPKSMVLFSHPAGSYRPMEILPVQGDLLPSQGVKTSGGILAGDRFYVDRSSPLPYSHILANPAFGTLVSDGELGFTWAVNARENKLTPWKNDFASGNNGEKLLCRVDGRCFSLTRGALASFAPGDARYEGEFCGIRFRLTVTVPKKGSVKRMHLSLTSGQGVPKQVEVAYYTEPVLGPGREYARFLKTRFTGRELILENPYQTAVPGVVVLSCGRRELTATCDRAAFLCGSWETGPMAPVSDPCAALVARAALLPGEEEEMEFRLAFGAEEKAALYLSGMDFPANPADGDFIAVRTPDEGFNSLISHFLPHQILKGRVEGRTAFYQCGGAYGFRDQLQDVCALLLTHPKAAQRQITRCCAVQFEEGDVLHWWHPLPKAGGGVKGVRTRFSDDLIFLPWAAAQYAKATGDTGFWDTPIPYLKGEELEPGEMERYFAPQKSGLREPVYCHCVRALERAYRLGNHGLPLMGCGDWNDGFSAVGSGGKGESVFVALFLAMTLEAFAPVCEGRGDIQLAAELRERAKLLKGAVDRSCWTGAWYLRAYFDSGSPMGAGGKECAIDSLPQSFAALAGMPDKERVKTALLAAYEHLADFQGGIVRLFEGPFVGGGENPGYIAAYSAGVRENGGQYTHGAIWLALALYQAGLEDKGWQLLQLLNPIRRCQNPQWAPSYKLEPYYLAADIYSSREAMGRGGWSLYTGAASWYYRAAVETVLGIRREGGRLFLSPHLPPEWETAAFSARIAGTPLEVEYRRGKALRLTVDGAEREDIPLDGIPHRAVLEIPRPIENKP